MDSSPEKSVMMREERKRGEQLLQATERREGEVWRDRPENQAKTRAARGAFCSLSSTSGQK